MARAPQSEPLTRPQFAELPRATLDNVQAPIADARLLLKASRWDRAYSLAILSAEEYGKFESCVVASTHEAEEDEIWKKFWKDFV